MALTDSISSNRIWFHGASVGDLKSLCPLIYGMSEGTDLAPVVTYWTREAALIAEELFPNQSRQRAPLPFSFVTRQFLNRFQVTGCVFEYLELFPGWVAAAKALKIPMGVVNGRVTERSLRIRHFLRRSASALDFFLAQSARDAEHAQRLGVPAAVIEVVGSTKRDTLLYGSHPKPDELRESLGSFALTVGSLHADEEKGVVEGCLKFSGRVLIAPRYLSRVAPLYRQLRRAGVCVALSDQPNAGSAKVVLLNAIGKLHRAYGLAPLAMVGGTFGKRGGQNLLEPITMGSSVIFGPAHNRVFEEASALEGAGGACVPTIADGFRFATSRQYPQVNLEHIRRQFPSCVHRIQRRIKESLFI